MRSRRWYKSVSFAHNLVLKVLARNRNFIVAIFIAAFLCQFKFFQHFTVEHFAPNTALGGWYLTISFQLIFYLIINLISDSNNIYRRLKRYRNRSRNFFTPFLIMFFGYLIGKFFMTLDAKYILAMLLNYLMIASMYFPVRRTTKLKEVEDNPKNFLQKIALASIKPLSIILVMLTIIQTIGNFVTMPFLEMHF